MADEKRIVIEIVDHSGGGGNASSNNGTSFSSRISTGNGVSMSDDSYSLTAEILSSDKAVQMLKTTGAITGLAMMAGGVVVQQAFQQINTYFVLTENYKAQQDISNLSSTMSGFGSILGYAAGGAMLGSALGPVGTAVGAVVGLGAGVTKNIFGGLNKQFEQNLDISTKGYSVEYNRNLAGLLVGESRNTEN